MAEKYVLIAGQRILPIFLHIRNKAIYSFETKIQLPPIPELTTNDWLKRCEFPLGVDNNREPWPL